MKIKTVIVSANAMRTITANVVVIANARPLRAAVKEKGDYSI